MQRLHFVENLGEVNLCNDPFDQKPAGFTGTLHSLEVIRWPAQEVLLHGFPYKFGHLVGIEVDDSLDKG